MCKRVNPTRFATTTTAAASSASQSVARHPSSSFLLDYGFFECTAYNIQHGTWSLISYSNSSLLIFMFLCTHMVDYMGCFGFGYGFRLSYSISVQFTSFCSYPFIFNSCPPFEHHTSSLSLPLTIYLYIASLHSIEIVVAASF